MQYKSFFTITNDARQDGIHENVKWLKIL